MVRGLALGEVEPADFVRVLGKELRVSAIVGAVLGIVNGLRLSLIHICSEPRTPQDARLPRERRRVLPAS